MSVPPTHADPSTGTLAGRAMAITPHTHSEGSADASTKGIEVQRMSAQVTSAPAIPIGRIAQLARPTLSAGKRGGESVPLH